MFDSLLSQIEELLNAFINDIVVLIINFINSVTL
jgi:hypothetical protein